MRVSVLSLLILLSACNSASDDDKEDLTPLRGGLTVGGENFPYFDGLPALSGDAGQLLFISGRQITLDEAQVRSSGQFQAFKIDLNSEDKTAVALTDGSHGEEQLVNLSPNAEYFAISSKTTGAAKIVLGALKTGTKQITIEDEFSFINTLAFSDDNRFFAFGFVDVAGKNKVRVYELPAASSSLSNAINFAEFELTDESAGLDFLSFAPSSTYNLFMRTQGRIYRCDFVNLQANLCSPQKIYEALEMMSGPNNLALDSQFISFFKQVSAGSAPIYIEEGHEGENLYKTVELRAQMQRISLDGQLVDTPHSDALGFSGYILASSLDSLQIGVFNEMYYCKATGTTLNPAATLKMFTPGSLDIERLILAQHADKTLSFINDPCAPPEGATILNVGLERVTMNRNADPDQFSLAFQLAHDKDREIYIYDHGSKQITNLAPNNP